MWGKQSTLIILVGFAFTVFITAFHIHSLLRATKPILDGFKTDTARLVALLGILAVIVFIILGHSQGSIRDIR